MRRRLSLILNAFCNERHEYDYIIFKLYTFYRYIQQFVFFLRFDVAGWFLLLRLTRQKRRYDHGNIA